MCVCDFITADKSLFPSHVIAFILVAVTVAVAIAIADAVVASIVFAIASYFIHTYTHTFRIVFILIWLFSSYSALQWEMRIIKIDVPVVVFSTIHTHRIAPSFGSFRFSFVVIVFRSFTLSFSHSLSTWLVLFCHLAHFELLFFCWFVLIWQ